ncbi:type IV pili methyl-accepting chemotaxis transducer N-terminal domain-containing protein [Uliginosibacterium sp. H3]|uniref:Type IV pili methyl-accepting chemotaxis transducer N-terminal domain-containing protein n=1 Tax=Uliginosibacterium silvisoli TaxID=3114758 RepID=A0ABU6K2P0_9RHOO|nr:type IV pili methyl-accepting chemotaxis transducer N-terminal domain-containing protein [Uliginosibacterium sp. H3]
MTLPAYNALRRRLLQAGGSVALLGLLPSASNAAPSPASGISMLEAINQAGRQRMLSQRMAKLYAQIIREVRQPEALKLIGESMMLFEKQLGNLRSFAQQKNATEIITTYEQLGARWLEYKKVIGAPPTGEGLRQVAVLNEQVLASAHAGTQQLEKLHGGSLGKLVNMSGRQRMLSQRISKFYFFRRDGIATPEIIKGLDTARDEFMASMNTLKQAPENNNDINSWIGLAESQWVFFDQAVRSDPNAKQELIYHDNNVAVTSENILQVMDKLTNLYSQLS